MICSPSLDHSDWLTSEGSSLPIKPEHNFYELSYCQLYGSDAPTARAGNAEAPLPDAVAAWTLLALLYAELPNRPKDVRNCLLEAARLNNSRGAVPTETDPGIYLQTARLLLDYHLPDLAEKALEEQRKTEGAEWGLEEKLFAARGRKLRGDLGGAAEILDGLLGEGVKDSRVAVELGHVRYAATE